jgi:hypothetical protein
MLAVEVDFDALASRQSSLLPKENDEEEQTYNSTIDLGLTNVTPEDPRPSVLRPNSRYAHSRTPNRRYQQNDAERR